MHQDIKSLLIPFFVPDLKRYGGESDGGYILSENLLLNTKYIYSYGIGGNEESITFDRHISLLNKDIYMYDGTIDKFWKEGDKFHFRKESVSSENIYRHIQENNHIDMTNMILKMDVEACEYETLLNCDQNLFIHFNQITIELHGVISSFKNEAIKLFNLLNNIYYLVHIHGNNHDIIVEDGVCNTLELTYIRKDCFNEDLCILQEPCPRAKLDYPNYLYRNDIVMNWWLE